MRGHSHSVLPERDSTTPEETLAEWPFCVSMIAMAASDSLPEWAGCHGYTDLLSPGSASRKLSARHYGSPDEKMVGYER